VLEDIITSHNSDIDIRPFLIYAAYQSVHAAPQKYTDECHDILYERRCKFCGIIIMSC